MKPTIYIGADHAGWQLKETLEEFLRNRGYQVIDMGNDHLVNGDDYPDFGYAVAKRVTTDPGSEGIVLCGNAQGICMVANKVRGARAATGFSVDEARTTRTDDHSNILCLPARFVTTAQAKGIVAAWLETPPAPKERYERRLRKLEEIENAERA